MIDDEINHNPNATLVRTMGELNEVSKGAKGWIDAIIIRNVITIIPARRCLKWHKPNCSHTEAVEVVNRRISPENLQCHRNWCPYKCRPIGNK